MDAYTTMGRSAKDLPHSVSRNYSPFLSKWWSEADITTCSEPIPKRAKSGRPIYKSAADWQSAPQTPIDCGAGCQILRGVAYAALSTRSTLPACIRHDRARQHFADLTE